MKYFLILCLCLLGLSAIAAPPPPIVRNYLTTNQTFLQVGALTNNGLDGWGFYNLTNLASAVGPYIHTNDGVGWRTLFNHSITVTNDSHSARITNGSFQGATFTTASPGSYVFNYGGGAHSGAEFDRSTNCFLEGQSGAILGAYFLRSSNSFITGDAAGKIGAYFNNSRESWALATEGAIAGAFFQDVLNCNVTGRGGGHAGMGAFQSTNCSVVADIGVAQIFFDNVTGASGAARNGSIAIGEVMSNERLSAEDKGFALGRDLAATNAFVYGIHGTNNTPFSLALANNGIQFHVISNGNISVIRGVTGYSWPTSHAAGALTNDGSGGLGWLGLSSFGGSGFITTNDGTGWNTTLYSPTNAAISTNRVSLTIQGVANQTGDLQQWLSSSGTTNALMRSNGIILLPINSSGPTIGLTTSEGNGIGFTTSGTFDFYQTGVARTRFGNGAITGTDSFRLGTSIGSPDISLYRLSASSAAIGTGVDSGFSALTISNLSVVANASITNNVFAGGNVTVAGSCTVTQTMANGVATVSLTADDQSVSTTNRSYIQLSSNDGTAGNRTFVLSAGHIVGQMLDLEWTGTNAGELVDDFSATGGGNGRLSATWTPTQYDVLGLRWNGTDWIERFRSAN